MRPNRRPPQTMAGTVHTGRAEGASIGVEGGARPRRGPRRAPRAAPRAPPDPAPGVPVFCPSLSGRCTGLRKFLPGGAEWRNRAVSDVEPSSLLICPKMRAARDGEGRGGRCWGPRRPDLGRPGRSCSEGARPGLRGVRAGTCALGIETGVQVPDWNPHFRIQGRATEDGKPHSWAEQDSHFTVEGIGSRGGVEVLTLPYPKIVPSHVFQYGLCVRVFEVTACVVQMKFLKAGLQTTFFVKTENLLYQRCHGCPVGLVGTAFRKLKVLGRLLLKPRAAGSVSDKSYKWPYSNSRNSSAGFLFCIQS
ncbi:hypothetical protein HPG69_007544 [Diceros bicornis minor]|uniref:Uncharacterized protein n=1 Tax=Diceros bicornis minor TaxID=77932 RepID=A0A7J7EZG6_DICBM|nr:hypothetical protein HPG69_007544 [Diceros bicornis minor]